MRRLARAGLRLTAVLALAVAAGCRRPAPINVVLIVVDTLRKDHLSCYGYARRTSPRIDALARQAMVYTRCRSQAPWTTPAVAATLTSQYPHALGITDSSTALGPEALLLSEVLRSHGYATGAVVSHSFCSARWNFDQGFEAFDESNVKGHDVATSPGVTARAIELLERFSGRPFFLWVHYFDPHFGYLEHNGFGFGEPGYAGPVKSGMDFGDLAALKDRLTPRDRERLRALYDSEIAFTDHHVGLLLDRLQGLGLMERTMVVLVADHGEEFLDHGDLGHTKTLYAEVLDVPLIVRRPGGRAGVSDVPAALIDVFPTVLETVGIAPPPGLAGTSLSALQRAEGQRSIFAETWRERKVRGVVRGEFKLIHNRESRRSELYNLAHDPQERQDLFAIRPGHADALMAALNAWEASELYRPRAGARVEIGQEERERLRALGYTGN